MTRNLYLPVKEKILLLVLPQVLVLSIPLPLPSPLTLLPLLLMITRDAFAAAKSALNGLKKVFDEKLKSCFSKFVITMANVFLIRKVAFIFKETAGYF